MKVQLCNATGRELGTDKVVCGSLVTIRNQYVEGGVRCLILPSTAEEIQVYTDGTIKGFVFVKPESVQREILSEATHD